MTNHLHLMPRLRMCHALHSSIYLHGVVVDEAQDIMAWYLVMYGATLHLPFTYRLGTLDCFVCDFPLSTVL
jgi:hypothetical protein